MYPIKAIFLAIVAKFVSCRPYGASSVSCIDMQPGHYNPVLGDLSETQDGPSPYTFTARWDRHMRMIQVSVSGDRNNRIQGFLIQGRLNSNEPAIGSFINITENPDATYQDCSLITQFARYSSVTHSNRDYQENLEFYWEPPTNISITGNVTFFATLAKNKNIYWVFEKSNSLPLNMEDLPTVGKGSSNKASVVVLLETIVLLLTTLVFLS